MKLTAIEILPDIHASYGRKLLESDPIRFVHDYKKRRDQEVVGLISALMAFGNVKAILGSVQKILKILSDSPRQTIQQGIPEKQLAQLPGHRWVKGKDLAKLFAQLRKIYSRHESLKELFLECYRPGDMATTLDRFVKKFDLDSSFLLPSPAGGSACKRLNMFLRWMVRPADGIDLGIWKNVSPADLIIPLDIHVYQFAKRFRLTKRKNPNWKFAQEVTAFLKTLDPNDPVKFDFAICHYGMEVGWAKGAVVNSGAVANTPAGF